MPYNGCVPNMQIINLLLTNYCNQGCPGCYASEMMADKRIDREMDLDAIAATLHRLNPGSFRFIKVLGGEPTLHSRFEPFIDMLLEHSDKVAVFTNGLFGDHIYTYLRKRAPRIQLVFNVRTPGFRFNPETRRAVTEHMTGLSEVTHVSASLTFLPRSDAQELLSPLSPKLLKSIRTLRFGITNPHAGSVNAYGMDDFPRVGDRIEEMVALARKINPGLTFSLDCGFTRCMFNERQLALLQTLLPGPAYWGCFLTRNPVFGDLQTDGKMIPCYPLAELVRIAAGRKDGKKAAAQLYLKNYTIHEKYLPEKCRKCPFYGDGPGQCRSTCLGFMANLSSSGSAKPRV